MLTKMIMKLMELNEGKKKIFDYRQFELFDKTGKKLALDEETKKKI